MKRILSRFCLDTLGVAQLGASATLPASLLVVLIVGGCSEKEPELVLTPVTGVVVIDGTPQQNVAVRAHPADGDTSTWRNLGAALTDDQGRFSISVKKTGDGLPAGEYVLTFEWGEINLITMQFGGEDKLKGRYADKDKSTVKFTVKEGQPVDLGKIELSTK